MENKEILDLIYKMFPNPHCELEYFDDFSFLCAVVLSAQTTDKAVNLVTKPLFLKYPTVFDIASSSEDELIPILRPIGLMKNKSHYLIKISKAIVEGYGGKVPHDFNELIKLPGVGRKTANVFLAEIDKRPAIAVDRKSIFSESTLKISAAISRSSRGINSLSTCKTVTCEPKFAYMEAYSNPMYPPPTIASFSGSSVTSIKVSLV